MMRKLTVCAGALVALLLLCSDARAQGCGLVYGGYGYTPSYTYAASYYTPSYYAPSYTYAANYYTPSYYTPSYTYAANYYAPSYYTPSYTYVASYYAPSYTYAASYYTPSYSYAASYGGYGYGRYGYRYNPGGLGGPYSGLGVRPGLGFGGFGLRR
jgi:hypothetical protein